MRYSHGGSTEEATVNKIRTDNNDIELEASLQQLVFNLLGDGVKTNVGVGAYFFGSHCSVSCEMEKGLVDGVNDEETHDSKKEIWL